MISVRGEGVNPQSKGGRRSVFRKAGSGNGYFSMRWETR